MYWALRVSLGTWIPVPSFCQSQLSRHALQHRTWHPQASVTHTCSNAKLSACDGSGLAVKEGLAEGAQGLVRCRISMQIGRCSNAEHCLSHAHTLFLVLQKRRLRSSSANLKLTLVNKKEHPEPIDVSHMSAYAI